MSVAAFADPRIVHVTPGRVRINVPGWTGEGQRRLESGLRTLRGVIRARANLLTANVLVHFDPREIDPHSILLGIQETLHAIAESPQTEPPLPHVFHERIDDGDRVRARIAVQGLDHDPSVARRVVETLENQVGVVRVAASALTGRVLVEYNRHEVTIEDLLAAVAHVDLPDVPPGDHPHHPLDPGPLLEGMTRTFGAGLGLAVLALRQLSAFEVSPGLQAGAGRVAASIGILQGFPFVRQGLRRLLGRTTADLLFYIPTTIVLTLAGSPLGLAVTGAESLRLLTEVVARRAAWKRYEERLEGLPAARPGAVVRIETGQRTPLSCVVLEGFGTASGRNGLPQAVFPGVTLSAASRLYGGPFVVELQAKSGYVPQPRPVPVSPSLYHRYVQRLGVVSLGYAALTGIFTRSAGRAFQALLLVNARPALAGHETADTGASARVLRAGVTVVGTRPERAIRLPQYLVLDGPHTLIDGFEVSGIVPLDESTDVAEIASVAGAIAGAAGSPWGGVVSAGGSIDASDGTFDGYGARAKLGAVPFTLAPATDEAGIPLPLGRRYRGQHILALKREGQDRPLGLVALRPRLAPGVSELVATCRRLGVQLELVTADDWEATREIGRRADIMALHEANGVKATRTRQASGALVAFASDSSDAAAAFAACDLAIGLTSGRSSHFSARADLLAPDLHAVAAILEAGARRDASVRDSVYFSMASNAFGVAWGMRGAPGVMRASYGVYAAALAAIATGWARLRGGERPLSTITRLVDPRPERWGRRNVADVLRTLHASPDGLTSEEAARRLQRHEPLAERGGLARAALAQLRSPLTAILAAGATLSLVLGSVADVVMIGATIVANVVVGVWQERQTGQAIAALERIGTSTAHVLRDGQTVVIAATDVVPGDVLVLSPGDRVAADARLITTRGLEVDESALTGESLPVPKGPNSNTDGGRIVLAGSDVTVGTGLAVVVAVGRRTRMGATAAALAMDETEASPLGVRLNRMLRQIFPLAALGGAVVLVSGLLRGRPIGPQFAIGASIAIAAVPEGLPLLAGVGEAAVARRLGGRRALVRRLAAVEALGRVDVACTDKTGTLTEGRLALTLVADSETDAAPTTTMADSLSRVLVTGALATPHPDAADAAAHPTDVAVIQGAESAGLTTKIRARRRSELSFDPVRSFHAALVGKELCLKGAAEILAPRCTRVRRGARSYPLDDAGREALLARAQTLAERGLRVLMVAVGDATASLEDPQNLTVLGFLGISDPLRQSVGSAVQRCREAGVRVVMLTGDHPATARAIAQSAGILGADDRILTGPELAELENGELDAALERVAVIARVTPLDKLRIVESLQRRGHTVAMTGDGVNDAPALRLADVGVAMGLGGTEVARQAADVVLADDNFATLVEALVEGRSFWRNIRRALGLLLGGNLGELGLVVGASALGLASPLLTRQILAVNLVTDVLPSLAVALQPPESRNLATLAREGTAALDKPLRLDVRRRGIATALPSLIGYMLTLRTGDLAQARSVAFASVVTTQLAQTLHAGQTENSLTRSVLVAVAGSAGVLVAALTLPPLNTFLGLVVPTPAGWAMIAAAGLCAVLLGRGLTGLSLPKKPGFILPAPIAAPAV